jgi:hypothetical protein
MRVLRIGRVRIVEAAGLDDRARPGDGEASAHAQMHDQRLAGVEPGQQVLGPPLQPLDACALQPRLKTVGEGEAQVGAERLDAGEHRAVQRGGEAAPHRLDLGEFRHGS